MFSTAISYEVAYEEETFLEQKDKVAGRVWVTTSMPKEEPKKIEVVLICQFKDSKIYRIWEFNLP